MVFGPLLCDYVRLRLVLSTMFLHTLGPLRRNIILTPCTYRKLSTAPSSTISLRRSYLYVPSSSERMLEKSLSSTSDMIIYDLEDSISPSAIDKANARNKLTNFLSSVGQLN